jgi:ABC-2 type transport system permease protein
VTALFPGRSAPAIAIRTVHSQRRSLAVWCSAYVGIVALYAAIWPSVKGNTQWQDLFNTLPESYRALFTVSGQIDLSTPAGYLGLELLSVVGPVMIASYAIAAGAAAIAGDEQSGTLEWSLAAPVSRTRLLAERSLALALGVTAQMVAMTLALWLFSSLPGMGLAVSRLIACCASLGIFGLFAGSIALSVGAVFGHPTLARGVAALVAVVSYLVNGLAQITETLRPARTVSPFHLLFGNDPLSNGLDLGNSVLVLSACLILLTLGSALLARRDLA